MKRVSLGMAVALSVVAASVGAIAFGQVSTLLAAENGSQGGTVVATTAPAATTMPANGSHADAVAAFQRARDLYQRDQVQAAFDANEQALAIEPTYTDAVLFQKVLQAKLGTGAGGSGGLRLLTKMQASRIRMAEMGEDDKSMRGKVSHRTLDDFWNQVGRLAFGNSVTRQQYNDFMNPSNFTGQVRAIVKSDKREFMDQVELLSDPNDLQVFRSLVHPYVLQNCATVGCHGGSKAGGFRLVRPVAGVNDAVLYTNFFILDSKQLADGKRLIDRNTPDNSLLLQYGMPRNVAAFPHPGKIEVRHFSNAFAPDFVAMKAWITGLKQPHPEYGVDYAMPGQ